MMLDDEYRSLLDGEMVPPSWVVAQLPRAYDCPGVTEVLEAIRSSDLPVVEVRPAHQRTVPDARWELELNLSVPEEGEQEMRLWVVPSEELDEFHLDWAHLADQEKAEAAKSRWSLGLSTQFGERPLDEFHRQLRVLATIAPDSVVFFDVTACRTHGASWVREVIDSNVPPPPQSLFAIHAVIAEKGTRGGSWLHTHGLTRCGIPELEIVDVKGEAVHSCGLLLNTVAAMFLEGDMPEPATPFLPGADMELLWLPWQKGLSWIKRGRLGGPDDRDEYHSGPSAILFAPRRRLFIRRLGCPSVYLPILEGNPLLYVSSMETRRMAALALERLDRFAELFAGNAGTEDWVFLVKLGYQVDDAQEEDDREHLWFEVHHLHGDRCEATLLNEPYGISTMHEGHRGEHELSLLTDWQILCPYGRFSADTVIHLQHELERELAARCLERK